MNDKLCIAGVDIGINGAVVIKNGEGMATFKMPTKTLPNGKTATDLEGLYAIFDPLPQKPDLVVFEDLHALFKAGKAQTWSLGYQAGAVEMLCIAMKMSYVMIAPKKWQEEMFHMLPPLRKKTGETDTKAIALLAVKQLYPDLVLNFGGKATKAHDGLVDALLLETYGRRLCI